MSRCPRRNSIKRSQEYKDNSIIPNYLVRGTLFEFAIADPTDSTMCGRERGREQSGSCGAF